MNFPDAFIRIFDEKWFDITYVGFLDPKKVRILAEDGENADVIWISDNFFVDAETGFAYIPA